MADRDAEHRVMEGKVCLVTGATSGIGKVTAAALASTSAQVIIHGRDLVKIKRTVDQISEQTGNHNIQGIKADFLNLQEVSQLAQSVREQFDHLDVLVNNAGGFFNTRQETIYGVEKTFLVNHLAPFLLTTLLMDRLVTGQPARIVNISSEGHRYGSIDFNDLEFKHGYFGMKAYARSKLANIYFTYELAHRLRGSDVTANAVHPGHVATDMWKTNFPVIGPVLKWAMGFFAISPQAGADTPVYLASSNEVSGVSGKYFSERRPVPSSPESYDRIIALKLWQVSERITSFSQ